MKRSIIIAVLLCLCLGEALHAKVKYFRASPAEGYHFPFYLHIPEVLGDNDTSYLVVEPNNTGYVSDKLKDHRKKAKRTVKNNYYIGRYVAEKLNSPLLVPVFPRTESDWKIYTHSLDRDAVTITDGELKRIDLQLIAMTEMAAEYLAKKGIHVHEQLLLTGFSASGTFVNRFTLIHPQKVKAVAAGGLNGLLALPKAELGDEMLTYPIGISDFQKLFGKPFNLGEFKKTPQYLFMGEMDDNDAIPYADGYDDDERRIIYKVLGENMQPDRWDVCVNIYHEAGVNASMKLHPGIGHEHPDKIKEDIVSFFNKALKQ